MPLIAGTIDQYSGSMAEAIQIAFLKNWGSAMGAAPPPPVNKQMQLLYVAIAEGIISYLAANKNSFVITTTFDGTNFNSAVTDIPTS